MHHPTNFVGDLHVPGCLSGALSKQVNKIALCCVEHAPAKAWAMVQELERGEHSWDFRAGLLRDSGGGGFHRAAWGQGPTRD